MGRLIDVDKVFELLDRIKYEHSYTFKEEIYNRAIYDVRLALNDTNIVPTEFDVNRVINELEKGIEESKEYKDLEDYKGGLYNAIGIVKAGGICEN